MSAGDIQQVPQDSADNSDRRSLHKHRMRVWQYDNGVTRHTIDPLNRSFE
jgi:hypothetical protein